MSGDLMKNKNKRIMNVFEFFRKPKAFERLTDLNKYIKDHPNASIEETQEEIIRLIYGEENVEWQMIFNKATALVVRLGDDQYHKHKDLEIEYSSIGFSLIILYKEEIVFQTNNGILEKFNKDKSDWIDQINELYDII
jgi:hypothetical protein